MHTGTDGGRRAELEDGAELADWMRSEDWAAIEAWATQAPLREGMAAAAAERDRAWGTLTTFSPKVFVPLTELCRDRCEYCTFAKAPARVASPYLDIEAVLAIARAGADAGCHEV